MKNKLFSVLAFVAVIALLSGCGKVPQAAIESTNAAITAAQEAEVDVYLADEFAVLQDSLNSVNAAIEAQKGKLFKNFGDVKEDLSLVQAQANELASRVDRKKEEIKDQAETMLNDIKSVVAENAKLVVRLPRGKEGAAVIEAIKADLAAVDKTVAEAQSSFDGGLFMDAFNKVTEAKEKSDSINTEIKDVLTRARIRF
ncbi:MAG: hypothetical protein GXY51_08535 [Bacteroidetes bacterium]|jgi:gas vesicle protein|nr:hypothetical protein [Bacteroidota bacterium]